MVYLGGYVFFSLAWRIFDFFVCALVLDHLADQFFLFQGGIGRDNESHRELLGLAGGVVRTRGAIFGQVGRPGMILRFLEGVAGGQGAAETTNRCVCKVRLVLGAKLR